MESKLNLHRSQENVKTWCWKTKHDVIYNGYTWLSTLCDNTQTYGVYTATRTHTQTQQASFSHTHIWLISCSAEKCSFVLPTYGEEQLFEWRGQLKPQKAGSEHVKMTLLWLKQFLNLKWVRCVCAWCVHAPIKGSNSVPNQINLSTLIGSLVLSYVETISEDNAVVAERKELLSTLCVSLSLSLFFFPSGGNTWRT